MKASEILREAGNLIEKKGWVRNQYYHAGRYCSVGALQQAAFGSPFRQNNFRPIEEVVEYRVATNRLAEVMQEQFDTVSPIGVNHGTHLIVDVNDNCAKNGREIVACFEKAAMLADG